MNSPNDYRGLRFLETAPDNYVHFDQRQRQWTFSYHHPIVWRAYTWLARLRCALVGHEWSPLWEHEKFDLANLGRPTTHCVFCGKSRGGDINTAKNTRALVEQIEVIALRALAKAGGGQ